MRTAKYIAIFVLILVLLPYASNAQTGTASGSSLSSTKHATLPPPPPKRPDPTPTPQEISLLLSGTRSENRILLTLNNNHRVALPVSATVFTASGREVDLPQFNLVPFESRLIELSPLLSSLGLDGENLGYIKLNYSGIFLGLGAQLTLYAGHDAVGVDSPRSLSSDFVSTSRSAAFWMFNDSTATIALSNVGISSITVHFTCGNTVQDLVIAGHTTHLQSFTSKDFVSLSSVSSELAGRGTAASCDMSGTGDVSSLRAVGKVTRSNGLDAPVRFYDPTASTSQSLAAPDLNTSAETRISVHNVTNQPVLVTTMLREATISSLKLSLIAPTQIPPHATIELKSDDAMDNLKLLGVSSATLELRTQSPTGALVGSVTQVAHGLVEDIPLKTPNPARNAAGAYPLRWDQDYTNRVSVTNTATIAIQARALITAGNITYTLPTETIPSGATKIYDVDTLRKERVKDVNGNLIPLEATYGKFFWEGFNMSKDFGLLGRNSVTSEINRRKSSFSCGFGCSYNSDVYPVFVDNNPIQYVPYGNSFGSRIVETLDTGGPVYQYPYSFYNTALTTDNSDIMSFGPDPSTSTSYAAASGQGGTTVVSYNYSYDYPTTDQFGDCDDPGPTTYPVGGDGGTQIPTFTGTNYIISSGATAGCPPSQAGWDKTYSRYIADQNGQLISAQQYWTENVVTNSAHDQLFLGTVAQATSPVSAPYGFYEDRLYFCSTACPGSATTYATQYQTVTLNGQLFTLSVNNNFVYACTNNTINGQ